MKPTPTYLASLGRVILGLSGGADSVALTRMFHASGADFSAVHCNFHLRGEESMRDQHFCEQLCDRLGVSLHVEHFDVPEYCRSHNISVETACRDLRYALFRRLMRKRGAARIAVAHNRDDQAETLLMNLFRGAGPRGLAGMQVDNGEIVRPLLHTSRKEILEYLDSIGQDYITDSSNLESDFRRNFIRNEVLPLVESRWPAARRKIAEAADVMRTETEAADFFFASICGDPEHLSMEEIGRAPSPEWAVTHFAISAGLRRETAAEICAAMKDGTASGQRWIIDEKRVLRLERDGLYVTRNGLRADAMEVETVEFDMTPELMDRIRRSPLSELWLPIGAEAVTFRHWHEGDRIEPLGMKGSSLLSDIFRDARFSAMQKECAVVCEERGSGRILWVAGLKRSRHQLLDASHPKAYRYRLLSPDR